MAYCDVFELRALDNIDDGGPAGYTEEELQEGIDNATVVIDRFTGTSFEYKPFTVTLDGNGSHEIQLVDLEGWPVLFPQTLTSATTNDADGNTTTETTTSWKLHPGGLIIRDAGTFTETTTGRNVVISGTAGVTSVAPADIAWACRTLARQHVLDLHSKISGRALSYQTETGSFTVSAQAGGTADRPTSLPEVNARLKTWRSKPRVAF